MVPPLAPLPYFQTQIINVFFVKFSGRELWVLLFVLMRTGWLIVKAVLIPRIMEKCWLLKNTLKWNMFFFCSNDIRIETMHDRFVQGNQERHYKT